jgi:hypothetical protein
LALNDEKIVDLHEEDWLGQGSHLSFEWTDQDFFLLGTALTDNTHLQTLTIAFPPNLCFGWDHARGTSELRQAVATMTRLHTFKLVRVCCRAQTYLLQGVAMSKSLRYLTMTDDSIDARTLAALLGNQPLPIILPSSPPPPDALATPLTAVPRDPPPNTIALCRLTHLILTRCKFGNVHMLDLALGLANNQSLLSLSITNSFISCVGIVYFCQHWSDDLPLEELDLSSNLIGAIGAHHLLTAASHHAAFQNLVLFENVQIGYTGLTLIGQSLSQNPHLHHLDLCNCVKRVPPSSLQYNAQQAEMAHSCAALAFGLQQNKALQTLMLENMGMDATTAQLLMHAVVVHPTMTTFSLAYNENIGLNGVFLLSKELRHARVLKGLILDGVCSSWPDTKESRQAVKALHDAVVAASQHSLILFKFAQLPKRRMDLIQSCMMQSVDCPPI